MRSLSAAAVFVVAAVVLAAVGCTGGGDPGQPDLVWGKQGLLDGEFEKPRAMAIDADDRLYLVDMTARIQVFDADGKFLRSWRTPVSANGRPSGLSFSRDGRLMVADTHYYRVLFYTPEGELLDDDTIGGEMGQEPGQFGFVTDAVEDSHGNFFVAEYGDNDRVQKFSPDGEFLLQWGGHGEEPGKFRRPQNLAIDDEDHLWVVDACNHRIQVFDGNGELLKMWGESGSEPGQMYYPYDLVLDGQGHVYVCEYGNHRIQKFTLDGKSLGTWGTHGRGPGQLHNPWALVRDSQGRLHVADSMNHRVQRIVGF
ncbi:MAG: hypothetical protein KDA44_20115 [Planctomycetales bacterium]|nr:hypothetical protein [Planctomycetales bacterium]